MKKILLISEVVPGNQSGGPIVLKRHIEAFSSAQYNIVDLKRLTVWKFLKKFFIWLEQTRFRPLVLSLKPLYDKWTYYWNRQYLTSLSGHSAVITMAHGRTCFMAKRVSEYYNIPLVTIFHDWYPVSSGAHPKMLWLLNNEFKGLYRASVLAFCVSEQMKNKLGQHPNSHVLYPIPGTPSDVAIVEPALVGRPINLFYSGFCGGAYWPMLQELIDEISGNEEFILNIAGSETETLLKRANSTNICINGFIPEEDWSAYMKKADLFLLVLNFDPAKKIHFETHFPSKLVDYIQYKKPVLIWGPSYASAIKWAQNTKAAHFVTDRDVKNIPREIGAIFKSADILQEMAINQAKWISSEFNPTQIAQLFNSKVLDVLK